MADWTKRTQTDNKHLANITSSRYDHLDGSEGATGKILSATTKGCRILSVTVCTKGVAFTINSGSRIVGVFTATSVEGTYEFGEYLENGLQLKGVSGSGSVNISFDV